MDWAFLMQMLAARGRGLPAGAGSDRANAVSGRMMKIDKNNNIILI